MTITILTLFPDMFVGPFSHSIVKNAQEKSLVTIRIVSLREFGQGKHKMVDDTAYGGGVGMVMKVDVIHEAIEQNRLPGKKETVVLLTASGEPFSQPKARTYSTLDHLILICGHYEGIDERITAFIDEEISVGDFVTTGGEIPSMLISDAIIRLLPGVLKPEATTNESFSLEDPSSDEMLLEYPQYTRPAEYHGMKVPEVLLSGDHQKIADWRHEMARKKTQKIRPDLSKSS